MRSFRVFTFLAAIGIALTCASSQSTSTDTIFIRHYTKNGMHTDINIRNITLLIPLLDLKNWTMAYIHGYNESVDSVSVQTVTNATLTTDTNVIAFDYSQIAANNYIILAVLRDSVSKAIAESLNKLQGSGLDKNKIHIVGHSFGGQVAGGLSSYMNFTLPRVTGLDPAGPLFYSGNFLDKNDGDFVDIIHTDKGFYGHLYPTGTVDSFPNYGRRIQPGCPFISLPLSDGDFCSHHRSWWFYAESVRNASGFLGVQCNDDLSFQLNMCNYTNIIPMGYGTPRNATGVYYLHTNADSPYARGLKGTRS